MTAEFDGLRQALRLCSTGSLDMALTRLGKTMEEMLRAILEARGVPLRDNTTLDALIGLFREHVDKNAKLITYVNALRAFRNAGTHSSEHFGTDDVQYALVSFLKVVSSAPFIETFEREARVAGRALAYLNENPMALVDSERVLGRIRYFDNVQMIYRMLQRCVAEEHESGHEVVVENIGLDHGTVWPFLRDNVLDGAAVGPLTFRLLILDPESPLLRAHCEEHVSLDMAGLVIAKWQGFFARHAQTLRERHIDVEYRRYAWLPVIHGFMVNRKILFWSFSHFREGRSLRGGDTFYHFCTQSSEDAVVSHYFKVFADWFDFYWKEARPV